MDGEPTTGWYSTRVELALAIGLVLWIALSLAFPPHFMGGPPEPPPIWMQLVPIAGFLGMLFGLVWMVRILRGPSDEPPPWRHRDH
jgi:hypothetical protein